MSGAYKTRVLPCGEEGITTAAALLRAGEAVAFPTETVYGLGADARNAAAVGKIFTAKGRPADNPLISHIASMEQLCGLAKAIPQTACLLADAFWPGPLTLVLEHMPGALPAVTTAGLSTFAVRMPSHPVARRLIEELNAPIAAPSANTSGRPSPTLAQHVLEDMDGRIPLILDGGACAVGLESTVVSVLSDGVTLLRPGGVTAEMLREVLGGVPLRTAHGVDGPLPGSAAALSPGMKHRHYAPNARMAVVDGEKRLTDLYDEEAARGGKPCILSADTSVLAGRVGIALGEHPEQRLFAALREADAMGATLILFLSVPERGVGHAVMNRALRAAGFRREGS